MKKLKNLLIILLTVFLISTNSFSEMVVYAVENQKTNEEVQQPANENNEDEVVNEEDNNKEEPVEDENADEEEEVSQPEEETEPDIKPETDPKPEVKPDPKPEPKPDPKPDPKPNLSANANLQSLNVEGYQLNFTQDQQTYNLVVENDVEAINIIATAQERRAKVFNSGEKELVTYLNVFNIRVEAENKKSKTYQLRVTKKDEDGNLEKPEANALLDSLEIKGCDIDFDSEKFNYTCQIDQLLKDVDIKTITNFKDAKVEIIKEDKLSFGKNIIEIIVSTKNNLKNTYTIKMIKPELEDKLKINDLSKVIDVIEEESIYVVLEDNYYINKTLLKKIMEKDKKVYFQKYQNDKLIYEWIVDGKLLVYSQVLKTEVNFNLNNKEAINSLINDKDALIINFQDNHNLPLGIKVRILLDNSLKDSKDLNLYYYNNKIKQLELKEENLNVEAGYLTLDIEKTSDYVLSNKKISSSNSFLSRNKLLIIGIPSITLLLVAASWTVIKKKRKNKNINLSSKDN